MIRNHFLASALTVCISVNALAGQQAPRTQAAGTNAADAQLAGRSAEPKERNVNVVTALKDLVGMFLLVALLPVWMAVGLGAVIVIVTRQLLWWARGNTTSVSRSTAPVMSPASP